MRLVFFRRILNWGAILGGKPGASRLRDLIILGNFARTNSGLVCAFFNKIISLIDYSFTSSRKRIPMLSFLRATAITILSAAIGSVVTVLITAALQQDGSTKNLKIEANHLNLKALNGALPDIDRRLAMFDAAKRIEAEYDIPGLSDFVESWSYTIGLRVYSVSIENLGDERVGGLELITENAGFILVRSEKPGRQIAADLVLGSPTSKLPSMQPGESIDVLIVTEVGFIRDDPIKILVDGRRTDIKYMQPLETNHIGLTTYLASHAPTTDIVLLMSAVVLVWLLAATIFGSVISTRPEWHAKFTSKQELSRMRQLLSYVDNRSSNSSQSE
jgi:predicted membrane protein